MFHPETTVPSVKGISRPGQAGIYLKFIVFRVRSFKHRLVPESLMRTRLLHIAIWLRIVGTQGEVAHE